MKVLLFPTCLVERAGKKIRNSTILLLENLGHEVLTVSHSTCCGQIAFNMGDWDEARKMARFWIETYLMRNDFDAIVSPSGSCVHMIRHNLPLLFAEDPEIKSILEEKLPLVFEIVEFIFHNGQQNEIEAYFPHTVTYHPSCHYLRGLKIKDKPRILLSNVRGLRLVKMEKEEMCCGFGGLFSIKMNKISAAIASRKAEYIEQSGAEYVTTPDLSCMLNLEGILRRKGSPVKVIHITEILTSGY